MSEEIQTRERSEVEGQQEFTEVWLAEHHAEAGAIVEMLQQQGLDAYLSESTVQLPPGQHRIFVNENDVAQAKALISAFFDGEPVEDDAADGEAP